MQWGSLNYSLYQPQRPRRPCRLPLFATYPPRLPWEHVLAGRGGLSAWMGWRWRASYSHHRLTKRWCLLIAQTRGMEGSCSTGSPQHLFPRQPPSQQPWPCPVSSVLTVVPYSAVRWTTMDVDPKDYGQNCCSLSFVWLVFLYFDIINVIRKLNFWLKGGLHLDDSCTPVLVMLGR